MSARVFCTCTHSNKVHGEDGVGACLKAECACKHFEAAPADSVQDHIDRTFPWVVMHGDHEAWEQTALVVRFFKPGSIASAEHVRGGSTVCAGCGKTPRVEELDVVERATGFHPLDAFRNGTLTWPA